MYELQNWMSTKQKEQIDDMKEKNKEFKKNVVKQMSEKVTTTSNSETTDPNENEMKYKTLYRKLKKEFDSLEKMFKVSHKENVQLRKMNQEKDKTIANLKEELYQARKHVEDIQRKHEESQKGCLEILQKVVEENNCLSIQHNEDLYIADSLQMLNRNLRKRLKNLINTNRIHSIRIVEQKDKLELVKKRLEKAEMQLSKVKERLQVFENMDTTFLIQYLHQQVNMSNINDYHGIHAIINKVKLLEEKLEVLSEADLEQSGNQVNHQLGYVTEKEGRLRFINLNGDHFPILLSDDEKYNVGTVVTASIDNDLRVAYIEKCFRSRRKENQKVRSNTVRLQQNLQEKDIEMSYPCLGDFSVLIVTANEGKKYVNRLRKHGLTSTWIDPFEKHPKHIKDMMKGYDIVIACRDSIPHMVLNIIDDQNDPKYQLMNNHNEELVVDRVRFAAVQLGVYYGHDIAS
ncbi:hypothetical protein ACFVS2_20195 [Brevibacillus sp. NPDC058079]|uniref:hypothetical protein n=1 Tax=Brevibacillus sp. NPDC058079 TaxID=3346330 RepID=UPI0036E08A08